MRRMSWGGRYSIVASTLALVFALGGTAYAVNTVRSADIVDGTIQSRDIGDGQVTTRDLKNGSVARADIGLSSLGRTPTLMARVNTVDGSLLINRGGIGEVTENSAGTFTMQAGRNITNCLYVATPRASGVAVSVDQASTTAVNIYLRDVTTGLGINTDFDIVFFC
jgi:hypothetical protein